LKKWIDFGDLGVKKSSAQIVKLYQKEDLIDKLVLAVTNFPPRQVADFMSEVLVLGVVVENGEVVLIQPDKNVPLGKKIS
jgi:tRNA-binding protein